MAQADDPRPAIAPALFWRVLAVANLLSLAIVLVVFHQMFDVAVMPELGMWFLIAGGLMLFPAVLYQARIKMNAAKAAGISANARQVKQLNQVVLGTALAELPGLMGTLYYLFTREWTGALVLLVVTVVLLLRTRPVS